MPGGRSGHPQTTGDFPPSQPRRAAGDVPAGPMSRVGPGQELARGQGHCRTRRGAMPPWGRRRGARSRLGTAHAALPQLRRRRSPFPAAAQRLLPWLRPAPASGRAMASVCAFCLLFLSGPGARGGGSGAPARRQLRRGRAGRDARWPLRGSLRTQVRLGAAGTRRGGGSARPGGWEWLWLPAKRELRFPGWFVGDGIGAGRVCSAPRWCFSLGIPGGPFPISNPLPAPPVPRHGRTFGPGRVGWGCRQHPEQVGSSLLAGVCRTLLGTDSLKNPSQVPGEPSASPPCHGLAGPCSASGRAQQILGTCRDVGCGCGEGRRKSIQRGREGKHLLRGGVRSFLQHGAHPANCVGTAAAPASWEVLLMPKQSWRGRGND